MYIAEYYNTLSGVFIFVFCRLSSINHILCSIALGIGTICLVPQMLRSNVDESAMLSLCYLILNQINKHKYPKKILIFILLICIKNYRNSWYFYVYLH